MSEAVEKIVESVFSDDVLLHFWTHKKCPPNVNEDSQKCQLDKDIKHERCMPCWESWLKEKSTELASKLKQAGWIDPITVIMPSEFGTPKAEEILAQWAEEAGYRLVKPKREALDELFGIGPDQNMFKSPRGYGV